MLYLVTGTPGSGKTLNTIKFINEQKQFGGREIYYFNIRDLDPALGWIELSEQEAYNWHDLPSNSVIIFDEAYDIFPAKTAGKNSPDHVQKLAVHRHKGFDVFLITQKSTGQVDTFVRGLVNRHQHYARVMGSSLVNRFTWDSCQNNTESRAIRKDANKDSLRFDKKYFGRYHSADEHTHTVIIPWRLISILAGGVLVVVAMAYIVYNRFVPDDPAPGFTPTQAAPAASPGFAAPSEQRGSMSFVDLFAPEIENMPWTAPAYRELIEPKTWPRPAACMRRESSKVCKCYTQQGTPLDVDLQFCLRFIKHGFFDWTRDETPELRNVGPDTGGDVGSPNPGGRAADAPPPGWGIQPRHQSGSRVINIGEPSPRMQITGRQRPSTSEF